MIINFEQTYKSIQNGGEVELPNFVVLTGKNGSGKTQLFEGIMQGKFSLSSNGRKKIERFHIRHFNSLSLSMGSTGGSYNPDDIEAAYRAIYKAIAYAIKTERKLSFDMEEDRRIGTNLREAAMKLWRDKGPKKLRDISYEKMVQYLEDNEKKSTSTSVFNSNLSQVFASYLYRKRRNSFHKFLATEEGEDVEFQTEEEFLEVEGPPPWEFFNDVLKKMNLAYEVTSPKDGKTAFSAQLRSTQSPHTIINFSDLSSGEKIILRLSNSIYHKDSDLIFPELLLLDEPDAHLHPSMTKQMIDTLFEVFAPRIKHGIIISTHSPSTCALAPEGSLYSMNSETRRPKMISLDTAFSELCFGIPILSIRKENERQIIVESGVDAEIYTSIWRQTKNYLGIENVPNLNFISSGGSWRAGSCEQAKSICKKLIEGGSTSSFALIDSDGKNYSEGRILVAGEGERYSIESFILNPLAIAGMLIHHYGDKISYGYLKGLSIFEFKSLSSEQFQVISDGICATIETKLAKFKNNRRALDRKYPKIILSDDKVHVETISGIKLTVPSWYNTSNGHSLEKLILSVFEELSLYGRADEAGKLMTSICSHVLAIVPEIIPASLSNTLVQLTE